MVITITINDHAVRVEAGTTVAAAILNAGMVGFRRSVTGVERAPLCGMGTCFECRVTVDGVLHRRSCMMPAADGMNIVIDGE